MTIQYWKFNQCTYVLYFHHVNLQIFLSGNRLCVHHLHQLCFLLRLCIHPLTHSRLKTYTAASVLSLVGDQYSLVSLKQTHNKNWLKDDDKPIKAILCPKFWWIVKELKEVFELEEFWGQSPNRLSRPCESATLVRGRFGGHLSNINSKFNFQTSLKFPQTQISLKKQHLQNLSPPSNLIQKFSKYSKGFLFIHSVMWLSVFSHFKIMTEILSKISLKVAKKWSKGREWP